MRDLAAAFVVFALAVLAALFGHARCLRFGDFVRPVAGSGERQTSSGNPGASNGGGGEADNVPSAVRVTPPGPAGYYTRESVQADPHALYLFGENDEDKDTDARQDSTQAVIRGLANAAGIRTCYAPGHGYSDQSLADNVRKFREDFAAALDRYRRGSFAWVVVPGDGLGTGVAGLDRRLGAAKTYAALLDELNAFLGIVRSS